jgi:hypothetical protein
MLFCPSKSASQSFCCSELLLSVETENCLINFKDVVFEVVSPNDLVPKIFNPLPPWFLALFNCLSTSFGDSQRNTFYALVRSDLPDNPGLVGVTTSPNGVFLTSSMISLLIWPAKTTIVCAFPKNV